MIGNYPDGLSEGTPGAPWNQGDPDPLICSECGYENECDEREGDPCTRWFNVNTNLETTDEDPNADVCPGRYESTRCTECNELACRCDP